jgi:outer membrane protein OmpU
MKKLLLTTALVGVAFVAAPAQAEVSLNLGGHFKGYVTWHDQDEPAGGADVRAFDMVRETEVHFTGETTLDNGLTVGFHIEADADGGDAFNVEESYAYFAGNWGRVNFGAEDGAAYLLQVAAPSADSNIDGIRQYVNPINYTIVPNAAYASLANNTTGLIGALDYDHVAAPNGASASDKLTYITPVFSGFQAAVSYTPDVGNAASFGNRQDNDLNDLGDAWELAARYEGQFNAVRLALGAGYSHTDVDAERAGANWNLGDFTDDVTTWNVGMNLGFGPFNVGAAYLKSDNGDISHSADGTAKAAANTNSDTKTWVLGADYTTGPWVLGASYLNQDQEHGAVDLDSKRYSAGVTYTYGPGMTFRGSVHHVDSDVNTAGVADFDATSFVLGTQINF